jgi:hypothetical protein
MHTVTWQTPFGQLGSSTVADAASVQWQPDAETESRPTPFAVPTMASVHELAALQQPRVLKRKDLLGSFSRKALIDRWRTLAEGRMTGIRQVAVAPFIASHAHSPRGERILPCGVSGGDQVDQEHDRDIARWLSHNEVTCPELRASGWRVVQPQLPLR